MIIPKELESKILPACLAELKEGRGQGEKEHYRPMIERHDMRGRGKRTITLSGKFPREHHTLSGIETNLLLILDFCSAVEDIREQFPLDILETLAIAADLGIKHPEHKGLYVILTADARITMIDGSEKVRSVKDKEALANPRNGQKLDIEEEYFKRMGISDWGIVTPGEIDDVYLKNVRLLREYRSLAGYPYTDKEINRARSYLETHLHDDRFSSLADCAVACEEVLSLEEGCPLAVAKHLIATKQWFFDLSVLLDPRKASQNRRIAFELPRQQFSAA